MRTSLHTSLLCGLLATTATCAPSGLREAQKQRQQVISQEAPRLPEGPQHGFVLPIFETDAQSRAQEIVANRDGYQYGPPLLGNTSYFPTGTLGDAMVLRDKRLWMQDVAYITQAVVGYELPKAAMSLAEAGGIQDLSSYAVLYQDQWERTVPDGVARGVLSNWTQDLYFSMERLSTNPYVVRRLNPGVDNLPFMVDSDVVGKIAGMDLPELLAQGRLFFGNHSIQATYPKFEDKYTAACSAYFFIDPESGDFMPLAIRTHVGADLVYTPLDTENEWNLAKMAFNMNDLVHGQIFHLAATHDVAEPVHQAALRTISARHPVRGYLDRVMYRAYAVRPIGDEALFNPGGFFDSSFAVTNVAGRHLARDLYPMGAGRFRSAVFEIDLRDRGLIECAWGPPLKHMPFYDDVAPMAIAIRKFASEFVYAYYTSEAYLAHDKELQAFMVEANDEARVLDFPPAPIMSRETLVDILVQVAFLAGVGHHVLNAATPAESSAILPLHPAAFYQPLPEAKGEFDIMPLMPNDTEALKYASLMVRFNRPLIEEQKGDLANMWSDQEWLGASNTKVMEAAVEFREDMLRISAQIRSKTFDSDGLSQGMPFLWRSMDPRRIPYYLSV